MADPWAAFPDAPAPAKAAGDPWAAFPDAGKASKPEISGAPGLSMSKASEGLAQGAYDEQMAALQGVSPNALSPNFPDQPRNKPVRLGTLDQGDETGGAVIGGQTIGLYKTPSGETLQINPKTDFILRDPETGQLGVYARNAQTDTGKLAATGHLVLPGLATGPVTGVQKAAQGAEAATKMRAVLATERADKAAEDAAAFQNMGVRAPPIAFMQGPMASIGKQLSETPLVGAPLKNALDESWMGAAQAAKDLAAKISPNASVEQTGVGLQNALDRYRTAGVAKLEPGVLADLGIEARAPAQAGEVMTKAATARAGEAAPLAEGIGANAVQSSRGVRSTTAAGEPVGIGTRAETMTARRSAADLSNDELQRLIRAPASETSFAARAEALYEKADRGQPALFKSNGARNPNEIMTPNAAMVAKGMMREEQSARISGGILEGRFGNLVQALANPKAPFTLQSLKDARTQIGRALGSFGTYDSRLDRSQLKQLYGAISKDYEIGMKDLANRAVLGTRKTNGQQYYGADGGLVSQAAARGAVQSIRDYKVADRYYRAGIDRMDRFARVVGTDNPQQAVGILIRASLDGTKGNLQLLRTAMSALRPEERNQLSALVLQELGKPTGSVARGIVQETGFSADQFLTRLENMAPQARQLFFGGEHAKAFGDLSSVVSRLANVEALANRSRSATNALNFTGAVGSVTAAGSAVAAGNPLLMLPPAALAAGGYGMSILMSRPSYVQWVTKYAQVRAAAARAPVNITAHRMTALINQLGQMARKDPQLMPVYRAIAAEENGVGQGQQQNQPVGQQPRLQ